MNPALQRLLDAHSIEAFAATDDEVVGRWRVAVGSFHDSRRVVTVEIRVSVCYQAGLQAAIALIRNAGYRLRSAPGGHHYVAFATLAALGPAELTRLADELNRLRRRRHEAVYDWRENEETSAQAAEELDRTVEQILRAGLEVLLQTRPQLASVLTGA